MKKQYPFKIIRNLRLEKGLSRLQVARLTGTSPNAITYYEIGQNTPTDVTLMKLAEIYELDFSELKSKM